MYALGPLTKLLRLLGGEMKLGKAVEVVELKTWTHTDKIKELIDDSGLSKSYIQDLIKGSRSVGDYEKIRSYLIDTSKSYNLTSIDKSVLIKRIESTITRITDNEILRKMINAAKDNGIVLTEKTTDSIADLVQYFV